MKLCSWFLLLLVADFSWRKKKLTSSSFDQRAPPPVLSFVLFYFIRRGNGLGLGSDDVGAILLTPF